MIRIEHTQVYGWQAAIRGMRNPLESWDKTDSHWCTACVNANVNAGECPTEKLGGDMDTHYFNGCYILGENDLALAKKLSKAGSDHGKYLRMINVTMDVTAPLYWWKEADTYAVGVVKNSCSTMHKIHSRPLVLADFSCEKLNERAMSHLQETVGLLNDYRVVFNATKDKKHWWQIIQTLPTSYNQKRTVQLNYQVLKNMYHARKAHKLDEWREFCEWVRSLPYSELITGEEA